MIVDFLAAFGEWVRVHLPRHFQIQRQHVQQVARLRKITPFQEDARERDWHDYLDLKIAATEIAEQQEQEEIWRF